MGGFLGSAEKLSVCQSSPPRGRGLLEHRGHLVAQDQWSACAASVRPAARVWGQRGPFAPHILIVPLASLREERCPCAAMGFADYFGWFSLVLPSLPALLLYSPFFFFLSVPFLPLPFCLRFFALQSVTFCDPLKLGVW